MARKNHHRLRSGNRRRSGPSLALFDPRLEVLAVTACAGTVDAERSTQNLMSIIERLDPPRMPRVGAALDPEDGAAVANATLLHGEDGLGNARWAPTSRQHVMTADKLISEQLRAHPGEITLVCTGPLSGIAKLATRDPAALALIDRMIIAGGSTTANGNVTAVAEFNMHFDPLSAQAVLHSPTTKSLIPLEVSDQITFGWELMDLLPAKYTKAGAVMHAILPHLFRTSRQYLLRRPSRSKPSCRCLCCSNPCCLRPKRWSPTLRRPAN